MADAAANAETMRTFFTAFYSGDTATMDRLVAPGFIAHAPSGGTSGLENWKAISAQMQAAMPDMRTTIDDLIADNEDKVAVRYTTRGTHSGELFGAPPTGRVVTTGGTEVYHLFAGQIIAVWGHYNMSELYAK